MGWKLKALALVIGLVSFGLSVWIIAVPLLLYACWGLISGRGRIKPSQVQVMVQYPNAQGPRPPYGAPGTAEAPLVTMSQGNAMEPRVRASVPKRYIASGLLLLLSLIALGARGTYSPLAFGAPGLLILFWDRLARNPNLRSLHPVDESIAFRRVLFPLQWVALGEIKLGARNMPSVLSTIEQGTLVTTTEKPSIIVVFRRYALTYAGVEKKLMKAMRETMLTVAPLHAYLLPLDSRQAIDALSFDAKDLDLDEGNLAHSLFSRPYEVISVDPDHGYVHSLAAFRMTGDREGRDVVTPATRIHPRRKLLLWDAFRLVEARMKWPEPDGRTILLGSMFATQGGQIGERILELNDGSEPQNLLVTPLGGSPVELSRVQLRAIVRVYTSE